MATPGPEQAAVTVRGVNHAFGHRDNRKPALHAIDLDLFPGEIAIMTGPSGSGKTTLLTLIGALRAVQEGSIRVLGRELGTLSPRELVDARRAIGFIFQAHNLFESLTARENVNLAIELTTADSHERDRRALEILTRLGLGDRVGHKPQALSGGQKQRVAVARALVNRPRVILADEPTAALDKASGRDVVDLLKSLADDDGACILLVTHDPRILDVADRIVNMVDGRIASNVEVARTVRISQFLQNTPLFANQPASLLAEYAERMQREAFPPDAVIIRQGDAGETFYVIESGVVEVTGVRDGVAFGPITLGTGEVFGEAALLTGAPRNATVVARGPVVAYTLAKQHFDQARARSQTLEAQLRDVLYRRS